MPGSPVMPAMASIIIHTDVVVGKASVSPDPPPKNRSLPVPVHKEVTTFEIWIVENPGLLHHCPGTKIPVGKEVQRQTNIWYSSIDTRQALLGDVWYYSAGPPREYMRFISKYRVSRYVGDDPMYDLIVGRHNMGLSLCQ